MCYVSDITNNTNRAWHLAWLNTFYIAGNLIGLIIGPVLFLNYGYSIVFDVAAIGSLISWFYNTFFIPETVKPKDNTVS